MALHWTYAQCEELADLLQGDVLSRTPDIETLLSTTDPRFTAAAMTHYIVATQSCDLARREGRGWRATHVSLAPVCPMDAVLHDLLATCCPPVADRVYRLEKKEAARQFLERLFNQNEHALGLFYLHDDAAAGIAEPSVAQLRFQVAVALDTSCYDYLVAARCGRLDPAFRSKLGWLLGNLFSRVATDDWPAKKRAEMVATTLDNERALSPAWVMSASVQAAALAGNRLDGLQRDEAVALIEQHKPPDPEDVLVEAVLGAIAKYHAKQGAGLDEANRLGLAARIRKDRAVKQAIEAVKKSARWD